MVGKNLKNADQHYCCQKETEGKKRVEKLRTFPPEVLKRLGELELDAVGYLNRNYAGLSIIQRDRVAKNTRNKVINKFNLKRYKGIHSFDGFFMKILRSYADARVKGDAKLLPKNRQFFVSVEDPAEDPRLGNHLLRQDQTWKRMVRMEVIGQHEAFVPGFSYSGTTKTIYDEFERSGRRSNIIGTLKHDENKTGAGSKADRTYLPHCLIISARLHNRESDLKITPSIRKILNESNYPDEILKKFVQYY